jgi:hypothetical protein
MGFCKIVLRNWIPREWNPPQCPNGAASIVATRNEQWRPRLLQAYEGKPTWFLFRNPAFLPIFWGPHGWSRHPSRRTATHACMHACEVHQVAVTRACQSRHVRRPMGTPWTMVGAHGTTIGAERANPKWQRPGLFSRAFGLIFRVTTTMHVTSSR